MGWKYSQDILHRKLRYLETLASEDGINTISDKWLNLLGEIQVEISFELAFRTLVDLYLILNLGFDWSGFDWPILPWDFPFEDITIPPVEEGKKAYYDISPYDLSYYDPYEITYQEMERFVWSSRYRTSEKDTLRYRKTSESLRQLLEARKSGLSKAGVSSSVYPIFDMVIAMAESRILHGAYVGFTVVGLHKVPRKHPAEARYRTKVEARNPTGLSEPWKADYLTESVICWESIVDWARVGHSRVGSFEIRINKAVSDNLVQRINDFWLRSGLVEVGMLSPYGGLGYTTYGTPTYGGYIAQRIKTLYQRTFMLQRVDQYHYKGGAQQLKQQFNIKRIRPILDRHGVMANFRGAYVSFANEVYYLFYDSHKLYKLWRRLVTEDDIVQKYVMLGCQEEVLREIQRSVNP